jgi:hypothetical protein
MRSIDHALKYTRTLGNMIRYDLQRKGIRKIIWKNKIHNKSIVYMDRALNKIYDRN